MTTEESTTATISIGSVDWETLAPFLCRELVTSQDIDKDVLRLTSASMYQFHAEGFYYEGELIGFGRYDPNRLHLAQVYVAPGFRGHGLAKYYINLRQIQGLWVMPENKGAIALYTSLGFKVIGQVTTRLYMSRLPFHLAQMPA